MYQWNSRFAVRLEKISLLERKAGADFAGVGDVDAPNIYNLI